MTTIELLNFLTKQAMEYRLRAEQSLAANSHMNQLHGDVPNLGQIDAVLTDFINAVAYGQCVDYAMYTRDLAACPYPKGESWFKHDMDDYADYYGLDRLKLL